MPSKKPKKRLQRVLILGSTLAFLSSTAFALISMFASSQSHSQNSANVSASREEQLLQAVRGYQSVLKREPNNSNALQGLIFSQKQLQVFYGSELQKAPDNGELLQNIAARNQEFNSFYQELETSYQDILQKEPNNADTLLNLAELRWQSGNGEGAIEPLEKLVKIYPDRVLYQEILKAAKDKIAERKAAEKKAEEANK